MASVDCLHFGAYALGWRWFRLPASVPSSEKYHSTVQYHTCHCKENRNVQNPIKNKTTVLSTLERIKKKVKNLHMSFDI
jgi:hypothetical protein